MHLGQRWAKLGFETPALAVCRDCCFLLLVFLTLLRRLLRTVPVSYDHVLNVQPLAQLQSSSALHVPDCVPPTPPLKHNHDRGDEAVVPTAPQWLVYWGWYFGGRISGWPVHHWEDI